MRDAGGTRFGTSERTTVSELTATPTYRITDRVVVRGDARFDTANAALFVKEADGLQRRQTTFAANVIFVYRGVGVAGARCAVVPRRGQGVSSRICFAPTADPPPRSG